MAKRLMLVLAVTGLLLTSTLPAVAEIIDVSKKVYWVRSDGYVSIQPHGTSVGYVMCQQGDIVLGGGFESSNWQVYAIDSRPIWQGWEATMYNTNGTSILTFQVYAICMEDNLKP